MEKVLLQACNDYEQTGLKDIFSKGLQVLGLHFDRSKVLLKPNLLAGKAPEKAVTTHPEFIRALSEILLDHGCRITIGDSPGYESTKKAIINSGIMDVVRHYDLNMSSFNRKVIKKHDGISPYKRFTFGEDPEDYDLVINLPKFKTHAMMGLTLGVKNTFGFIHSFEKARWHLRAGQDRMLFASALIDIHTIANPHLTVLDGILGMDGDGPSNGRPRNIGVVAMSRNAFILDDAIERLVKPRYPLPITVLAGRHGLIKDYETVSYDITPVIEDFRMPATMATDWGIPRPLKTLLKNTFIKKPKIRQSACKQCGICIKVCPAGALSPGQHEPPIFDYKRCIRCYCCQEMCPEGAIRI
ncbi:MAG: formate hydrogenlyase complex iron-sulfur subunit [Syntrophorhabdus sp. PtaU1.Bin058]|nr:MAG: formate hydrogenlyase complex iron-sulfur subunit [Syntrophorhabdus sp. PtaU1.Bin058]